MADTRLCRLPTKEGNARFQARCGRPTPGTYPAVRRVSVLVETAARTTNLLSDAGGRFAHSAATGPIHRQSKQASVPFAEQPTAVSISRPSDSADLAVLGQTVEERKTRHQRDGGVVVSGMVTTLVTMATSDRHKSLMFSHGSNYVLHCPAVVLATSKRQCCKTCRLVL